MFVFHLFIQMFEYSLFWFFYCWLCCIQNIGKLQKPGSRALRRLSASFWRSLLFTHCRCLEHCVQPAFLNHQKGTWFMPPNSDTLTVLMEMFEKKEPDICIQPIKEPLLYFKNKQDKLCRGSISMDNKSRLDANLRRYWISKHTLYSEHKPITVLHTDKRNSLDTD